MSERFLKYETEAENGMVNERGLLIPSGSAGGYKYFGICNITGVGGNMDVYKMDSSDIVCNPSGAKNGSDVTRAEFEEAYISQPIMLVPINKNDGMALYKGAGMDYQSVPVPLVSYSCYNNNTYRGSILRANDTTSTDMFKFNFATE